MITQIAGLKIMHDMKPMAPPARVIAIVGHDTEPLPEADLWVWAGDRKVGYLLPYSEWTILRRWRP